MERLETRLDGPVLVRAAAHPDDRGVLPGDLPGATLSPLGVNDEFVQDNHSRSARGVVRGTHFQVGAGVAKLVRCGPGAILDVVVAIG